MSFANCEDELSAKGLKQNELVARTKFVDQKDIDQLTKIQLSALIETYQLIKTQLEKEQLQLQQKLQSAHSNLPTDFIQAPYKEQIRMEKDAGIHDLNARTTRLAEDVRGTQHFISAVERSLQRLTTNEKVPDSSDILTSKISVAKKYSTQVMNEISQTLETLKTEKSKLVLRYFPIARQDLVLRHGTDLHGRTFNSGSQWDEFGLEALLHQRGLRAEDGFYAVPYELAADFGVDAEGKSTPFAMIDDFIRGDRALAVYDLEQLEDHETDYFIFKSPAKKKKALLAIILPKAG